MEKVNGSNRKGNGNRTDEEILDSESTIKTEKDDP